MDKLIGRLPATWDPPTDRILGWPLTPANDVSYYG